ncbi:OLC1v1033274C1 [Oldenlandia corymbosa var. corymbosa]|nr:OLC1v1033274C1 [Oldenlandia corymbosa var. corymbosa]
MYAPYISEDLRLHVLSLLYVGVSVETIMQRHKESVERQGGPSNRDDLLNHRHVRRQERIIRRFSYELDSDDAISVSKWVESHQSWVFFYEDYSDSEPFALGIQTEWQLQQMIRFGNRSLLASDSRFGTNKLKYPVHSLVVFNSENKAIPVAWMITPKFASGDAYRWMRALYNRVRTKDPLWKVAGFIVDDPLTDTLSIKEVFQCPILICFWRVRHAWHKNLMNRCSDMDYCAEISKKLGESVSNICKGHGNAHVFEAALEDFIDASDFVDYFKAVWSPRLGLWVDALKSYPMASHEASAAMESYHHLLRLRLVNEKDNSVYERADWLVHKLGTKVHSYFWLDEYSGKGDFARYWKDEWFSGLTAWRKSMKIPDDDITMEDKIARVVDQEDRSAIHIVRNPGSEYALCDCDRANAGNLCDHVFKTIRFYRDKKHVERSLSMLQYHQALMKILHCPQHDSLARDYASSLAVWVQMQLDSQIGQPSSSHASDSAMEQVSDQPTANQDSVLLNENPSRNDNGSDEPSTALVNEVMSENDMLDYENGTEVSRAEMEIDA